MEAAFMNCTQFSNGNASSANPYRALAILQYSKNKLVSKLRILSKLAVLPTGKTFSADPKCPISRHEQAEDGAWREMLISWRLPRDGPDAIKANQSEFAPYPQITFTTFGT